VPVPSKERSFVVNEAMEAVAVLTKWQAWALPVVAGWVWVASFYNLTQQTHRLVQSWVTHRVLTETPSILRFQVRPSCISHLCLLST
jgi:hypothetical protein